jgi:hypothetical protein
MSAIDRVRRARATLLAAVAGSAVLWGAGAALAVMLTFVLIDSTQPLPLFARHLAGSASFAAALVAMVLTVWRGRRALSLARVGLFIEERVPALQFALATAIEGRAEAVAPVLERVVDLADYRGAIRTPALKAIGAPVLWLLALLVGLGAAPRGSRDRVLSPRVGDVLTSGRWRRGAGTQLSPVVVRVTPPRYSRLPVKVFEDPSLVTALVGSRVEVLGRLGGAADVSTSGIGARLRSDPIPVAARGDTWSVVVAMPVRPTVLRLANRLSDRLLTLEPIPDLEPMVTLLLPLDDTTYGVPRGRVTLVAEATDDYGLDHAQFEVLRTSGSGEQYKTKGTSVDVVALDGRRTAQLRTELALDSLSLGPGDVLHVRAVAVDQNDVSGPGEGSSETRTIRIADPRERDTVRVDAGPAIVVDTTVVSERMLIARAEALRRRHLAGTLLMTESRQIAETQDRLRSRVDATTSDLDEVNEGGDFGPTSASPILHRASAAMVDAEGALNDARLPAALPYMYQALALLDSARTANRLYLRGVTPHLVVDVAAVRLSGTDSANGGTRVPGPELADTRRGLAGRIEKAYQLTAIAPSLAADSITMIRLDALTEAPEVAEVLGRALDQMRSGSDPSEALLAARRRLERPTLAAPALSDWVAAP